MIGRITPSYKAVALFDVYGSVRVINISAVN